MTNLKYKIRRAKPTDAFFLLPMMKEFLKEAPIQYPPVDDFDCLKWLLTVIDAGGALVAIADKKIIGSIGFGVSKFDWNSKFAHMFDEWYYVAPEYRSGSDVSRALITEAKKIAKEANLAFVFSISSGKDKRIDRFISMQGFSYAGFIGVYNPWEDSRDGQEGRIDINVE